MNLTLILFYILAVTAVATAAGLLLSRNSVYAALFLVLNFATVAVFYLLLGAPFIALAVERFLTVPDPRLAVLKDTPRLFRAIRIRLTEPG